MVYSFSRKIIVCLKINSTRVSLYTLALHKNPTHTHTSNREHEKKHHKFLCEETLEERKNHKA